MPHSSCLGETMAEVNGFVSIIKPTGMSSFEVVSRVKRILHCSHVGHLGTLDPAASGVLVVAVGRATKFFDCFLNKDKVYVAIAEFGVETDTLDSFGNITKTDNKIITADDISGVLNKFIGRIEQAPPKYSAIKINGKKAYELARQNIDFETKFRTIEVFDIKFQQKKQKNAFLFKIHCSAGTYVRSLLSDIAHELNTFATVPCIIRTASGAFDICGAKTLSEFEESARLISIEQAFSDCKFLKVSEPLAKKLINGAKVAPSEIEGLQADKGECFLCTEQKIIGLYQRQDDRLLCKVYLMCDK